MLLTVWTEVSPPDYCVKLLFPADDLADATCEYSKQANRRLISYVNSFFHDRFCRFNSVQVLVF